MKLAVIGSRSLTNIVFDSYICEEVIEIVSGGAVGVDSCAAEYAKRNGIRLVEFLPQYEILVFWDGISKGTISVIKYAQKMGKPHEIILCQ